MVSSRCISSLPLWYYFLFLRPQGPSNLNILRSHFPRIFPADRYVSAAEPLSPCTEILHYVQDDRWEAGKPLRAANAALLHNPPPTGGHNPRGEAPSTLTPKACPKTLFERKRLYAI